MSHIDWNGDGVAEVLYGEPRTFFGAGGDNYRGRVVWLDGDGASGSLKLSDSDAIWDGRVNSDAVGDTLSAMDVNEDGYGDVAIAAPGRDDEQSNGGAVYLMYGSATGATDDELEDIYDLKVTGHLTGAYLGSGVETAFADVDGDDDLDSFW